MASIVYCDTGRGGRAQPRSGIASTRESLADSVPEADARGVDCLCRDCGLSLTAWRDGFSCFESPTGGRQYFQCPDGLERDTGESAQETRRRLGMGVVEWMRLCRLRCEHQYLCTSCRRVSLIDEVYDRPECPGCGSAAIVRAWDVVASTCPCCGGTIDTGPVE